MKQKLIPTSFKMSLLYRLLSLLYLLLLGSINAQTHPFIIVKETEYSNLQALATGANAKPEFTQMRNTAINTATNRSVNVTASMLTRSATVRDIMDACALAYILDPAKRNVYRDKFYATLKFWDLTTTGNLTKDLVSTSWDNSIPAEGAVFATVIAMDIMYSDPNTTPAQIIQRNGFNAMMERPGGDGTMGPVPFSAKVYPYHNQSHSAARGIWAIWKGGIVNNPALDAAVTLYKGVWLNYSSPDGVSREYTGYSLGRSGDPKRYQKAAFQDVIAYSGIDANWYSNPRMLNFNEWMAGYSLMPNKYSWPLGDTQYASFDSDYLSPMSRAGVYSLKAGQYAEWAQDGKVPRAELFTYLLKARAVFSNNNQSIVAKIPESRIFNDGGAYLIEKNAGKQAMAVVLANLKYGAPGPETWGHTHFDVNNLCMAGFGEILLRGPGYNGYAAAATDANNFGFNFHYVNSSAVSNNVALFDYNIGTGTEYNYKNPSYTNAHAKKLGGQGVQGLLCNSLDYAMGDTSPVTDPNRAITKGQHIRHVVAVYPQDGINGYTYVMDELIGDTAVNVTNGQLTWHPYSAEITTNANNASNDRYEWKIRKYANTTDQLYLSIFMPTAPTAKQQYDGLFADDLLGGNTHSFVGKYIFNTYALNTTTKKKNVLTTLFPRKSTDAIPTMARINTTGTGTATQAVAFSFSGNVTDFSMESDGTNERTIVSDTYDVQGASAQGKMAVYRKIAGNLAFYFVAKGRSFKNKPTGFTQGFVSNGDVNLYLKDKIGNISTEAATKVRFYIPGIGGVKINNVVVANVATGTGWVEVNVPTGTSTIELMLASEIINAPTGFVASNIQARQATLTWVDNSNNETAFVLEKRNTSTGGNYELVENLQANTITLTDTNLLPSSTYQYRLSAKNATLQSTYTYLSNGVVTPAEIMNTPTGFVASNVQARQATLTWVDNSNNETVFVLEKRNTVTGGNYELVQNLPADVLTFTDTNLVPSSTYQYRLSAKNTTLQSAYTYLSNGVVTPAEIINAPTGFVASNIQARQATLTWVDNSNNETAFVLEKRNITAGGNYELVQNLPADVLTFTDTNLVPSSTYQYRLSAKNATLQSTYISLSNDIVTLAEIINVPTGFVTSNIQATQATLTWIDNSNNETAFVLERRNTITGGNYELVQNLPADVLTFTDTNLVPSSTYQYRLSAKNATLQSAYTYLSNGVVTPADLGTGLQGTYYNNVDFTGTQLSRIEPTVNFNWALGSPDASIGIDTFSARWKGQVKPQFTETYTFFTTTDDGVRLWVNDVLLINKWVNQGATEYSGSIVLTAGQKYNIVMEYYESTRAAVSQLSWSSASQQKQIIPETRLYATTVAKAETSIQNATKAILDTDVTFDKSVSIYPNPANEQITVVFDSENANNATIELLTINSRVVSSKLFKSIIGINANTLDVSALETGIYILKIKNGSEISVKKVIIKR